MKILCFIDDGFFHIFWFLLYVCLAQGVCYDFCMTPGPTHRNCCDTPMVAVTMSHHESRPCQDMMNEIATLFHGLRDDKKVVFKSRNGNNGLSFVDSDRDTWSGRFIVFRRFQKLIPTGRNVGSWAKNDKHISMSFPGGYYMLLSFCNALPCFFVVPKVSHHVQHRHPKQVNTVNTSLTLLVLWFPELLWQFAIV